MSPAPPAASIVVLNYDGRALLDANLGSLLAQEHASFEVLVVDNGSSDGSVAHLAERWPQVRVHALAANIGVTAALNVMAAQARGEWVALLNNDVELAPDWLPRLVAALEAEPGRAAAAGKLLRDPQRELLDRAGDELRWSSAAYGRGAGEPDRGQYDAAGEVFAVGGAAALYRRSALAAVGPFDERYFAYLEDVDWGLRARLAGFTAWYEPAAVGYHQGGATLGEINPFSLYHLRRNQLWLVLKNYPGRSLLRHGPAVLLFNLHAVALAVAKRDVGVVARAYRDAVRGLPGVLRARRRVQRTRRIGARELERVLAPAGRPW